MVQIQRAKTDEKVVKVGTSAGRSPFILKRVKVKGFDAEIIEAAAKKLDIKLNGTFLILKDYSVY